MTVCRSPAPLRQRAPSGLTPTMGNPTCSVTSPVNDDETCRAPVRLLPARWSFARPRGRPVGLPPAGTCRCTRRCTAAVVDPQLGPAWACTYDSRDLRRSFSRRRLAVRVQTIASIVVASMKEARHPDAVTGQTGRHTGTPVRSADSARNWRGPARVHVVNAMVTGGVALPLAIARARSSATASRDASRLRTPASSACVGDEGTQRVVGDGTSSCGLGRALELAPAGGHVRSDLSSSV